MPAMYVWFLLCRNIRKTVFIMIFWMLNVVHRFESKYWISMHWMWIENKHDRVFEKKKHNEVTSWNSPILINQIIDLSIWQWCMQRSPYIVVSSSHWMSHNRQLRAIFTSLVFPCYSFQRFFPLMPIPSRSLLGVWSCSWSIWFFFTFYSYLSVVFDVRIFFSRLFPSNGEQIREPTCSMAKFTVIILAVPIICLVCKQISKWTVVSVT